MASASSIGQFNFIRNATSSFDSTLTGSSTAQRQWMAQTYSRMRGYPPFFDQALSWAPPSDFYRDLYALYRDADRPVGHAAASRLGAARLAGPRALHPLGLRRLAARSTPRDIGTPPSAPGGSLAGPGTVAKGYAGFLWTTSTWRCGSRTPPAPGNDVQPDRPAYGAADDRRQLAPTHRRVLRGDQSRTADHPDHPQRPVVEGASPIHPTSSERSSPRTHRARARLQRRRPHQWARDIRVRDLHEPHRLAALSRQDDRLEPTTSTLPSGSTRWRRCTS